MKKEIRTKRKMEKELGPIFIFFHRFLLTRPAPKVAHQED
jgi:hypothetical protein